MGNNIVKLEEHEISTAEYETEISFKGGDGRSKFVQFESKICVQGKNFSMLKFSAHIIIVCFFP